MQIEKQPSRWKVMGTQGLAYLLTVIITIAITVLIVLMGGSTNWYIMAIVFWFSGVALAEIQLLMLREWFPQNWNWTFISGGAMPLLIFGENFLFTPFIVNEVMVNYFTSGGYTAWYTIQPMIVRLSLFSGFLVGLPGGLVFGLIQAFFIPWYRRLWWWVSALAWGLIGALLLVFVNVMLFLLYLEMP